MSTISKDEEIVEWWVCTGHAILSDNNEGTKFLPLKDGKIIEGEKERLFKSKGIVVGGVYEVTTNAERTKLGSREKFVKLWIDEKQRAVWLLDSKAARATLAYERRIKTAARDDPLERCLAPLAEVYYNAHGPKRRVIELTIIDYLNKYAIKRSKEKWNK